MNWSWRMIFLAFLIIFLMPAGHLLATEEAADENLQEAYVKARVIEIENLSREDIAEGQSAQEQLVTVQILEGEYKGRKMVARNTLTGSIGWDIVIQPGDKVILYMTSSNGAVDELYVSDIARIDYVTLSVLFFMLMLVVIGGIKGIKALVALALTAAGIYKVLLPAIMAGYSPILVTVVLMLVVTMITMFIVGGLNSKSLAATLGTTGGVLVAGILALLIGEAAHLTGFATEESRMLLYVENFKVNMEGLLFAGIIIGTLGATMDVAMSISSTIEEVKNANPMLKMRELVAAGMNVGRDVMGTMANTLILAYAGSALPLMILYLAYQTPTVRIFSSELIATEVIRAITGSIGLICAVPLTALIAGFFAEQAHKPEYLD